MGKGNGDLCQAGSENEEAHQRPAAFSSERGAEGVAAHAADNIVYALGFAVPKGYRAEFRQRIAEGILRHALQDIRDLVIEECAASLEDERITVELARILNIIATDGFPEPRDPDVAVEAIVTTFRDFLLSLPQSQIEKPALAGADADRRIQQEPDTL